MSSPLTGKKLQLDLFRPLILALPLALLFSVSCSHEPLGPLPWEAEIPLAKSNPKPSNGPEKLPEKTEEAPVEEDTLLPPEQPMWKPGGPAAVPIPTSEFLEETSVSTKRPSVTPLKVSGRAAIAVAQFSESELAGTCKVCGDFFGHNHKPVLANLGGREFLVCSEGCVHQLRSDPRRFLTSIDSRDVMPVPPAPPRKDAVKVAFD